MTLTRRHAGLLMLIGGAVLVTRPFMRRLAGQERAPSRPEFTLIARNYRYSPDRIEVTQDDLVKLTIRSEDVAYSFTIDEYRIVRRVPPGGTTTFEFRADRPGSFRFYSNLTNDGAHAEMQGQLVVRPR
ncbi:MAG TPA: cupredoxin domain-containing protein [Vicinamibacterales bacterium]